MMPGNGQCQGSGKNVFGDGFVTVIRTPHGDPPLSGFVGLQQEEAILIK